MAARRRFRRGRRFARRRRPFRRRRRYVRRRRRRRIDNMGPNRPLPQVIRTRHRYVSAQLNMNPGAVVGNHVFRLNSIYDPDVSLTGHQVMGFDQLAALYDHYQVLGCKARITFQNTDGSDHMICGAYISDTSVPIAPASTADEVLENPCVKWRKVAAPAQSSPTMARFTVTVNPAKWLGRAVTDNDLRGSGTSNPSELCFLMLFAYGTAGTPDLQGVKISVQLDYYCRWSEPKKLGNGNRRIREIGAA